jgi:hypothetical protein
MKGQQAPASDLLQAEPSLPVKTALKSAQSRKPTMTYQTITKQTKVRIVLPQEANRLARSQSTDRPTGPASIQLL